MVYFMKKKNIIKEYGNPETLYKFNDALYEKLNIPKPELIDNHSEIWAYIKFDRDKDLTNIKRFMVSTYGRVYDTLNKKIIKQFNGPSNAGKTAYYKKVLFYLGYCRHVSYFVHRLVALTFIPVDETRPFVNHIDGCPEHNYLWNLEWVTNSENVLHAVRTGLKKEQRGEERPNAKWTDDEVRLICSMMEEGHKATYIYKALGDILQDPKVQYERVRTLYKHIVHKTHWTHISKDYNIDFTAFNYAKEKGSVEKTKTKTLIEALKKNLDEYSTIECEYESNDDKVNDPLKTDIIFNAKAKINSTGGI